MTKDSPESSGETFLLAVLRKGNIATYRKLSCCLYRPHTTGKHFDRRKFFMWIKPAAYNSLKWYLIALAIKHAVSSSLITIDSFSVL